MYPLALQSVMDMTNQGFIGALVQYWTVEEKPRLHRRNSWFREHELNPSLLIILAYASVPVLMILVMYSMLVVML